MVFKKKPKDFFNLNFKELQTLSAFCCNFKGVHGKQQIEDVFGAVTHVILNSDALGKYDKNRGVKISTYLFTLILNVVRGYIRDSAEKVSRKSFSASDISINVSVNVDDDSSLLFSKLEPCYQNMIQRNLMTDQVDGLRFDLECFEEFIQKEENDRTYTLNRCNSLSKGMHGLKVSDVFKMLLKGMYNNEIAEKYGVSNMFITLVKKDIAESLERFGLKYQQFHKIRKESIKYTDFDFEEEPHIMYPEHH